MFTVADIAGDPEEITGDELRSLLSVHGQDGCYVKAEDDQGQKGAVLDGWFDLEAVATAINQKTRSFHRQV